jgi:hypothetical protein
MAIPSFLKKMVKIICWTGLLLERLSVGAKVSSAEVQQRIEKRFSRLDIRCEIAG